MIEDDGLLKKIYNNNKAKQNIWDNVSADISKNFIASLSIKKKKKKKNLKIKIKSPGDEFTNAYVKKNS